MVDFYNWRTNTDASNNLPGWKTSFNILPDIFIRINTFHLIPHAVNMNKTALNRVKYSIPINKQALTTYETHSYL